MQNSSDDIFKQVFQEKLSNHEEVVDEMNWDLIAANLEKKRFYKFSFTRFTVYHAVCITAALGLSVLSVWYWASSNIRTANPSGELIDTVTISSTVTKTSAYTEEDEEEEDMKPQTKQGTRPISTSTNDTKSTPLTHKDIDTIKPVVIANTPVETKKDSLGVSSQKPVSKPVIKKTIFVVKQDTVIKVDTVKSKKNRKNK